MKTLIFMIVLSFSFNTFGAEVGEQKSTECKYAVQSADRDKKPVEAPSAPVKSEEKKAVSK